MNTTMTSRQEQEHFTPATREAIAGEAVVPLLSLSIPILFEMVSSASGGHTGIFGDARSPSESSQAERETAVKLGRRMIHDLFEQGKKASPCVMCIDELDALARPEMREVCEQWQSQLRSEMDGCDTHPAMAVMATISRREQIDQLLLVAGCFDQCPSVVTSRVRSGTRWRRAVWATAPRGGCPCHRFPLR